MADQPVAISDINDPTQIRVRLLASGRDVNAPMTAFTAASIHGAPTKATPVNADELGYWDSVGLRAVKATWTQIKTFLFAAIDTLTFAPTPATTNGYQIAHRPDVTGFPVMTIQATTADTATVLDVIPKGAPSDVLNNGLAWLDLCAADILANPSAANTTARLGIRSTRADVGVRVFSGGSLVPLYFVMGSIDAATLNTDGSFTFNFNVTANKLIGGSAVGSSLTLQSTSGVGTSDFINFKVGNNGATEAARFTTSGQFLFGSTVAYTTTGGALTPQFQIHGTSGNAVSPGIFNWVNSAGSSANLLFNKSKSGTIGTRGIVASGDTIGSLIFYGDDGTNFVEAAKIQAFVDGTPGTTDMPGRITISTSPDGSASATERLRIDNTGFVSVTGGSFGRGAPVTKTADFTVATTENNLINNKAAATCTVTLPAAASFPGREIMIKNLQAFTVVSASSNVVPLAGGAAGTAILSANAGRFCTLVSDGTNWVIMGGVI